MLERYINVTAYLRLLPHGGKHIVGETGRIGIVKSYPLHAGYGGQTTQQTAQTAFSVKVHTVVGGILRHHYQLLYPAAHQSPGLFEHLLLRNGYMGSADKRNGTIGAPPIAPFRNFQVGVVSWRRQHPFRRRRPPFAAGQGPHYAGKVACSEIGVHFGNLAPQLLGIPLAQAAYHEKPVNRSLLLGPHETENGIDGLLLGIAYEPACIDHHRPCLRSVGIEHHVISRCSQLRHNMLGVHHVFGTAERNDIYLFSLYFSHHPILIPDIRNVPPRLPSANHGPPFRPTGGTTNLLLSSIRRTGRSRTPAGRKSSTGRYPPRYRCSAPES